LAVSVAVARLPLVSSKLKVTVRLVLVARVPVFVASWSLVTCVSGDCASVRGVLSPALLGGGLLFVFRSFAAGVPPCAVSSRKL
jgi:hypothetical protein